MIGVYMADGIRGGEAHPLKDLSPEDGGSVGRGASKFSYEKPRSETLKHLSDSESVHEFASQHTPDVDVETEEEDREDSLRWFQWGQELASWMKEARTQGDQRLTDHLWQSYAKNFPSTKHLLKLKVGEKRKWDQSLQEFFFANPAVMRAQSTLQHLQELRKHPDGAKYAEQSAQKLTEVLRQLTALEKASFSGSIPGAEAEVVRLQRLLILESSAKERLDSVDKQRYGEAAASRRGKEILGEERADRLYYERSAAKARQEYGVSKQQLMQKGSRFRDALLAAGVQSADIVKTMSDASQGNFSSLEGIGSLKSRLVDGWRAGGFFRALKDAARPNTSVLMEQARDFHRASKNNLHWQAEAELYRNDDQGVLGVSFSKTGEVEPLNSKIVEDNLAEN